MNTHGFAYIKGTYSNFKYRSYNSLDEALNAHDQLSKTNPHWTLYQVTRCVNGRCEPPSKHVKRTHISGNRVVNVPILYAGPPSTSTIHNPSTATTYPKYNPSKYKATLTTTTSARVPKVLKTTVED